MNETSPGTEVVLSRSDPDFLDTIAAHRILCRAGVAVRPSHAALTELFDEGSATLELPAGVEPASLSAALLDVGIVISPAPAPDASGAFRDR